MREGYNVIAVDVMAERGNSQTYLIEITKSGAPPPSGGALPQSFQPLAVSETSRLALANSSSFDSGWQSRSISAEPLLDGGVRFVFIVSAEKFKIKETVDLLGGIWRPLPDDEFKATRESIVHGQDRLTIILPMVKGEQRFLRLMPQR